MMPGQRSFLQLPYDIRSMVYSHLVPAVVHVTGSYESIYSTSCYCYADVSLDGYWHLVHQEPRLPRVRHAEHFLCASARGSPQSTGLLALLLSCRTGHDELMVALQRHASVYSFDDPGVLRRFVETAPASLINRIGLLTIAWFVPGPVYRPRWHPGRQVLSSYRWKTLRHWKSAWKVLREMGGPRNIHIALLAPHAYLDFVYRHGMLEPFTSGWPATLKIYYYGWRTEDVLRCKGEVLFRSFEDRVIW